MKPKFKIGDTVQYISPTSYPDQPSKDSIGTIDEIINSHCYRVIFEGYKGVYWINDYNLRPYKKKEIKKIIEENRSFTISLKKHKRINLKFAL